MDGVFDAIGNFHPIPKIDTEKAMIIFREKVFKMLKDNNRISDTLISKMRHWNHSGFSVNNEVYINKDNPEALERLAQYIVHSKIVGFIQDRIEVERIMRHIDIWPVEYPEMQADKRASPMNFKLNLDLLSKRMQSKYIN